MEVKLIKYTVNPVQLTDECASVCYDSESNGDGKISGHCYNSGHLSVLEHASFTFRVSGVSRACTHQLVRHRTGKYTQRSQRYCKEDNFSYVVPPSVQNNKEAFEAYTDAMEAVSSLYDKLISYGVATEDARYILPNACCSTIYVTFDGRNLLHFMNERLCSCAQWEIRSVAEAMKRCLKEADGCEFFFKHCVPKCEAGKVKYCNEPENRSCHRHPTASAINKLITKED